MGIEEEGLKLFSSSKIVILEGKRSWKNDLFIMRTKSRKVRLNLEHSGYRWVKFDSLTTYAELMDSLENGSRILARIRLALKRS